MNLDNQTLKAIQHSKAYLKKQLNNETNPHIQEKIKHQIQCLNTEETEILNRLNIRLNDIEITDEEHSNYDTNRTKTHKI